MTIDVEKIAAELVRSQADAIPVELISERHPELDWTAARSIARATDALHRASGRTQIGWKLGWTSSAMREALGIDRPNWGTLWDTQLVAGPLDRTQFIHPKAEPELVWMAPTDISEPNVTADDLRTIGGDWSLGIEVVDPRFPSFEFDALDNTADNSSSAAVVLGVSASIEPSFVDSIEVTFSDGSEERSGVSSLAMGSPWEAAAWLVRSLAEEGLSVGAGDIVFTGGLAAPFDVEPGARYSLTSSVLDSIELVVS